MYAPSPSPLQNIPSFWTASDIADMHLLQTKLDWLCKETRHGNGLCPTRHEVTIRDVLRIGRHLAAKEEAFAKAY